MKFKTTYAFLTWEHKTQSSQIPQNRITNFDVLIQIWMRDGGILKQHRAMRETALEVFEQILANQGILDCVPILAIDG